MEERLRGVSGNTGVKKSIADNGNITLEFQEFSRSNPAQIFITFLFIYGISLYISFTVIEMAFPMSFLENNLFMMFMTMLLIPGGIALLLVKKIFSNARAIITIIPQEGVKALGQQIPYTSIEEYIISNYKNNPFSSVSVSVRGREVAITNKVSTETARYIEREIKNNS